MSKRKGPIIYREDDSPFKTKSIEKTNSESPTMKAYRHEPRLNIENKIAIFEGMAKVSRDQRRVPRPSVYHKPLSETMVL